MCYFLAMRLAKVCPFKKLFGVFGFLFGTDRDELPQVCDVIPFVGARRGRIFVRLRKHSRVDKSHGNGILLVVVCEVLRKLAQAEFQEVGHGDHC